ncbi:ankyrin repeat domain-containing protein [Aspergillus novofumigatus IBT 16806]|uniref:Ankyrin n=1 Tax=Aspergillus novofumigatus (strain IBT 16806) TaxID=1392255 RepID=A0A2I1BVK9_ASPN1|nr:ankyrin [Aspergillus novofumigatus IBT 16806]PKX89418.1 ankyrin [Aspergillus novofumigatus IBT 16806]
MGEMVDLNSSPGLTQDSRMLILPYEILLLVAELLPLRSWNALARTCRHLYNAFMPSLHSITVSTKNGQDDVLKWAARKGSLATIHRLTDYAPKGYFNCVYREAALHKAACTGQTEIIRWLLDSGIDPYCTQIRSDNLKSWGYIYGDTPLESAVIEFEQGKQTALLESILRRGIAVDQRDSLGRTAMFQAVINKHIPGVILLLGFGADINATDAHQVTPLDIAADMGQEAVVELLLQRGARVDMTAHGGQTSLHVAISANSIMAVSLLIKMARIALDLSLSDWIKAGILKLLLDAGADFTVPNIHGNTPVKRPWRSRAKEKVRLLLGAIQAREAAFDLPESPTTLLHAAIFAQHDLAYRLLAQGADVNQRDRDTGWTALMEAAQQEQDGLFDLVLQKSLDINAKDAWGRTALSFAAEHGSEYVVLLLLRQTKGVDLADDSLRCAVTSAVAFGDAEFLESIHEKGKIDRPDPYGHMALRCAARMGNLPVVKWLLNQLRTPLMLAVYRRNGAQLLSNYWRTEPGLTPEMWTMRLSFIGPYHVGSTVTWVSKFDARLVTHPKCGHPVNSNIVKMLVEAGADLEAKNAMDGTPLTCAAINGSESAISPASRERSNVESRNKSGLVPLLLAASKGHTAVACLLLEYGASIDSVNADGDTALMLAAHNGHHETILSVLKRSAQLDRVNYAHRTALSWAAEEGRDKAVEILLCQTPLLWALQNEHERCVDLLVQGFANVTKGNIEGRTPLGWALRDGKSSQKGRDAHIRILYDRHPASSSLLSTKHARL